jgi:DNA-directed RNA polymerase subunit RPC12/RpoP
VVTRYRCASCGNLTRFDVTSRRRTRAFHHFSLGGDLTVEEEQVLDEVVEEVRCRWCGTTGTPDEMADRGRLGEASA